MPFRHPSYESKSTLQSFGKKSLKILSTEKMSIHSLHQTVNHIAGTMRPRIWMLMSLVPQHCFEILRHYDCFLSNSNTVWLFTGCQATHPISTLSKNYGKILKRMKYTYIIFQLLSLSKQKLKKYFCDIQTDKKRYISFLVFITN